MATVELVYRANPYKPVPSVTQSLPARRPPCGPMSFAPMAASIRIDRGFWLFFRLTRTDSSGSEISDKNSYGSFHENVTLKNGQNEIVFDRLWYPLSILLLAAIGAKLIGPHGGLQVDKNVVMVVTGSVE